MKKHTLSLAVLTAMCSLLALPTIAASGDGARQRVQTAVEERLEDMDTNNDGKISQQEFTAARMDRVNMMFSRLDKDGDGLLTKDELTAAMPQAGGARAAGGGKRGQRAQGGFGGGAGGGRGGFGGGLGGGGGRAIARGGVDRDAIAACIAKANPDADPLERQDPAGIVDRFASFDTNGDGKLSKDELTTAVTARTQAQFARLDRNDDGFLDKSDRDAAQAEREQIARAVRDCMRDQR